MKIAIIGAGAMGGATAIGLAKGGGVAASDITVTAAHASTLERFASMGMNTSLDNADACRGADIVMIVVKPWLVGKVVAEILPVLDYDRQIIACLAAGIDSEALKALFERDGRLPQMVRIIPNTAVEVLQSMTFISAVNATDATIDTIGTLFSTVGSAMEVDESRLEAGMALASCGIAYALRYVRAASEGGVELGIRAADSTRIVAQTLMGAAGLLLAHDSHPEMEIDKVTTPGGITIKGLNRMEECGFTNAVIQGLKASVK